MSADQPPAYLDWAATAPLHPAARDALLAALDSGWADPALAYAAGRRAGQLLQAARATVGAVLGVTADRVFFPASGSQAAQAGIAGVLAARARVGNRLVTSAVEHSCVLGAADAHAAGGGVVHVLGVDENGRIDPDTAAQQTAVPGTALMSVQTANHEVGTLQPIALVAQMCQEHGVPLHTDAAQAVGRLPVTVPAGGLLTASAHKWGGPAGVGVLALAPGTRWRAPWPTDERGGGRVPGFENVPAVVAAAAALHAREGEREAEAVRLADLVERLRTALPQLIPGARLAGDPDPAGRLPNLVTVAVPGIAGQALLTELDRCGVAVGSGASCTSAALEPAHVLRAMGFPTAGTVRVSLGRDTRAADVDRLLGVLPGVVATLQGT